MTTQPPLRDTGTRPNPEAFAQWLAEAPRGQLPADLSEALTECVHATEAHGAASTMTLTVKLEPSKAGFGALDVTASIKTKPATPPPPVNVFFATPDGGLSRKDPNNQQLPGMEQ